MSLRTIAMSAVAAVVLIAAPASANRPFHAGITVTVSDPDPHAAIEGAQWEVVNKCLALGGVPGAEAIEPGGRFTINGVVHHLARGWTHCQLTAAAP